MDQNEIPWHLNVCVPDIENYRIVRYKVRSRNCLNMFIDFDSCASTGNHNDSASVIYWQ